MVRRRLLMIDDEPAINALVKRVAEGCGYEVLATSQPDEFREAAASAPPDLIGLDLVMPAVDGFEMIGFLADIECRSPIFIMSGFDRGVAASAMRLADARGLNVLAVLAKPIRVETLRDFFLALAR